MRDHSLTNESVYDRERMERQLHELAKANGLSRRRFLQILAGGAGLAALSDMPFGASRAWANHVAVVKPTPDESFIIFPTNREMRWEAMKNQGYYTPNAKFFVRNHTRTPHVDVSTWRLRIDGSGVSNPIDLTYGDLLSMEQVTETKFIECAGNGRRFYGEVLGQPAAGTPWRLGAIGVADLAPAG